MTVGFFTGDNISISEAEFLKDCDAALFIVKELSFVRIKSELNGEDDLFLKMGDISKRIKGVCFFSLLTDFCGVFKKSVACYRSGKLVAIADMNEQEGKFSASYGLKSMTSGSLKFGVLVGRDILDIDRIRALALTENDAIINLSADILDFDNEKLVSTIAYLGGLTIVSVNQTKKVIALNGGETLYSGRDKIFKQKIIIKKRYGERTSKILI